MKKLYIAAVVFMLLGALGVMADCSTGTNCAQPGSPAVVSSGTATVAEGAGVSPVIKYVWVLPDDLDDEGTQLEIVPSGERNDIYACVVVADDDGRDTIQDVFVDVYHPDASFKYQVHATRITSATEVEACKDAAVAAGLITSSDHVTIDYNIFDQQNWYMYKVYLPMYYHQPSGDYEARAYAVDSTSRMSAPLSETFEWVPGTYLSLDFSTVNFGNIQPGAWKILNGDTDMATPLAPTVKNDGNTEVVVGIKFSDFLGSTMPIKKISSFDAQLRNMVTANNYLSIPGEHLEFASNTLVTFANPVSLCRQEKLDLSIHAPVGTVPNAYSGTVTVYADAHVVSSPVPGATYPVTD